MTLPLSSSLLRTCLLLAAVVALAALLRGMCLNSELWLDEVWSWEYARQAQTPWQIFTAKELHHDNNHKLNTLYLYFVPDGAPFAYYRLHSFVAGLASVLLAFRAAARRGVLEGLFAALLIAVNYWFVLCAAEARGYALALAFALAAFDGLQRHLRDGGRWYLLQFQIAMILGFLAHLTFLHAYLALSVWTVYHFARQRATKGHEVFQLLRVHALPVGVLGVYFGLLYLAHGKMEIGGADPIKPEELNAMRLRILGRLMCYGLGLPFSFLSAALAMSIAFAVFVRGFQMLRRDHDDSWVFFAMALVGTPLMMLLGNPAFIFERYFYIPFLFFMVLFAYVLGDLARRLPAGKVVAGVVLALIALGNFNESVDFASGGGRGEFQEALQYIAENSDSELVTITSDSDLRVPKMIAFYSHYVTPPLRYRYVPTDEWRGEARLFGLLAGPTGRFAFSQKHAAEWLIVEYPEHGRPPEKVAWPDLDYQGDAQYELDKSFPVKALGGWDWHVLRRAAVAP